MQPDGSLWSWGNLTYDPGWESPPTLHPGPVHYSPGTHWLSVAVGEHHVVAVRQDGTLWTWGSNARGQLGTSITAAVSIPLQVGTATTWRQVTGGASHTLALQNEGTLWGWGSNARGQLGTRTASGASGSTKKLSPANKPPVAGNQASLVVAPTPLNPAVRWRSAAAGATYTLALRADGTLWIWGEIEATDGQEWATGQPGRPPQSRDVIQVGTQTSWKGLAAGHNHALALQQDGSLWAWGDNHHGQLGTGSPGFATAPVQVAPGATWISVAAGRSHTVAVRHDGTLWAWGNNEEGQLGDGTTTTRTTPVQIGPDANWQSVAAGRFHTVALRRDGSIWAWGNNDAGQLGYRAEGSRVPQLVAAFGPASR
ncbi:hypothetical protein GCM10027348_42670 [Hymenobacter tenuis]